jgi:hypothetical protein
LNILNPPCSPERLHALLPSLPPPSLAMAAPDEKISTDAAPDFQLDERTQHGFNAWLRSLPQVGMHGPRELQATGEGEASCLDTTIGWPMHTHLIPSCLDTMHGPAGFLSFLFGPPSCVAVIHWALCVSEA